MLNIKDCINSINEKNALLPTTKRQRELLTVSLFKKILTGIAVNKTLSALALELSISKDLILDVKQEFEINISTDADRLLRNLADELTNLENETIKRQPKKDIVKTMQTVQKQVSTSLNTMRKVIDKKAVEAAINKNESLIPDNILSSFKADIEYGMSRMRSRYGKNTILNLTDEELKEAILKYRPNVQEIDAFYFKEPSFEE